MSIVSNSLRFLANTAWIGTYRKEHARFSASLSCVKQTQEAYLQTLLRKNADTRFGQRYRFEQLRTIEDYQAAVPITAYEDLSADIAAIARGETGVLCMDAVKRFLPTSGSSSASKHIPWTATLSQEFHRGIAPWLFELYRKEPELLRGSSYWSISPATTAHSKAGVIPVGFENDSAYLGYWSRQLFGLVSAVPPRLAAIKDVERFKDETLVALLSDERLCLISVWSPSFLSGLLEHFIERQELIVRLLAKAGGRQRRKRADWLQSVLKHDSRPSTWTGSVWPRLRHISCWDSGPSALQALRLQQLFPGVRIQGKGLVSTEAFASLPFGESPDPVLAVRSHFFEFQHTQSGRISLAHELSKGESYRLIVTTGGGLHRYTLGDLIEVSGYHNEAPCFHFLGREGNVSDHCGEKLNGRFVQTVVDAALKGLGIQAVFYLLAPVRSATELRYVLFLELSNDVGTEALGDVVEKGLRDNFHYDYCRKLGQLEALKLYPIGGPLGRGARLYTEERRKRGMKLGDIKLAPLDKELGWETVFSGQESGV